MGLGASTQLFEEAFQGGRAFMGLREVRDEDDLLHLANNRRFAEVWGRTPEELVGALDSELGMPLSWRKSLIRRARRARASGRPQDFELTCGTPQGVRAFCGKVVAVDDLHRVSERFLFVAEEVTEQRSFEAELTRAERLASWSALCPTVAPQLRHPTTSALLNLGQLRHLLEEQAETLSSSLYLAASEALRAATEGVEQIGRTLRELEWLAARAHPEPSRVELDVVVRAAVALHCLEERGQRVSLDLRSEAVVAGDARRLAQVVLALLTCAAGSAPTLSTFWRGERAVLELRDAGDALPRARPAAELELELAAQLLHTMGGELEARAAPEVVARAVWPRVG